MIKRYKLNKHNSTVCGYPGRNYDWSKFCWDGSAVFKSVDKGDLKAPLPYVDDFFIPENCQYLHVPYDFAAAGTICRVRPNATMYAGKIYRGHLIKKQTAVERKDGWYWKLIF